MNATRYLGKLTLPRARLVLLITIVAMAVLAASIRAQLCTGKQPVVL